VTGFLFLFAVGFFAAIANSVVGGGTFITFPALVFIGVPPIVANATSSVALTPGVLASAFAYRHDLKRLASGLDLRFVFGVTLAGGLLGAFLLTHTPERIFVELAPWLLLFATLVFTFGRQLNPWLKQHVRLGQSGLLAIQFLIGIYGGYFGAGIGILMLALLGVYGLTDLSAMNGLRTLLAAAANLIAIPAFILGGVVDWPAGLVMAVAAILGGYAGAMVARRMKPEHLRPVIIVLAFTMTAYFFIRS
jgi:uncharacterized membrane protein YfcA